MQLLRKIQWRAVERAGQPQRPFERPPLVSLLEAVKEAKKLVLYSLKVNTRVIKCRLHMFDLFTFNLSVLFICGHLHSRNCFVVVVSFIYTFRKDGHRAISSSPEI